MFIRLLKAIVDLVVVATKLGYVYLFYPSSKTSKKRAENIIDPEYNPTEYGSGENAEALKEEWTQGMDEEQEAKWRQKYMSEVYDFSEVDTDYNYDPSLIEPTKKILSES